VAAPAFPPMSARSRSHSGFRPSDRRRTSRRAGRQQVPSHVPIPTQSAAKARGFSRTPLESPAQTDSDGLLHSFGSGRCLSVGLLRIRGELAIGGDLRATDLYAVGSFDPDHDAVMRIGGEAPGGGPILSVGSSARFEYGIPPPRIGQFGSRAEASASTENGAEWYARSGELFQDAGRKTTPSNGSPVVTKRQSAMISLRASATIMVLRVPLRLSAVRARYHNASALSF
jgi:hypothetical protein